MRTANPALSDKAFSRATAGEGTMTLNGTVHKTFILLALLMASGTWSWMDAFPRGWSADATVQIPFWYIGVLIGSVVVALVTIFKKTWAPFTAPIYAVLEGLLLGVISVMFQSRYPGIVVQAMFLTFGVLGALLLAYQSGWIRATENFKLGVVAATGGIFFIYLINFVMGFFGSSIPVIHSSGTFGILFSLGVVVVASLNLVLDFDFIEKGVERGAPKYMEWYAGFGLLVTLIWLYLEMLRLLAKTQSRK